MSITILLSLNLSAQSGCMNPLACNYDPNATESAFCLFPGCTDPEACNYWTFNGCDDGSCAYYTNDCNENCVNNLNERVGFLYDYYTDFWQENNDSENGSIWHIFNSMNFTAPIENQETYHLSKSIEVLHSGIYRFESKIIDPAFNNNSDQFYYQVGEIVHLIEPEYFALINLNSHYVYVPEGETLTFGVIKNPQNIHDSYLQIHHFRTPNHSPCFCTDPFATNFNPEATEDNGSCEYNYGCSDYDALNYTASWAMDNETCAYLSNPCTNDYYQTEYEGLGFYNDYRYNMWEEDGYAYGSVDMNEEVITIIGDENADGNNTGEYNSTKVMTAHEGIYSFNLNVHVPKENSNDVIYYKIGDFYYDITPESGGSDDLSVSYYITDPGTNIEFGIQSNDENMPASYFIISKFKYPIVSDNCGCMNEHASNYNSSYTQHDPGSCQFAYGCQQPGACNYDSTAIYSDLCIYNSDECGEGFCPFDAITGYGFGEQGQYGSSNWEINEELGNGFIDISPGKLFISGSSNSSFSTNIFAKNYAVASGIYSFDWKYWTEDSDFAADLVVFQTPNQSYNLYDWGSSYNVEGEFSVYLEEGDFFKIYVDSDDEKNSAVLIENFKFPLPTCFCAYGDADLDGDVDLIDLLSVSSSFGCNENCDFGDANCDGVVNVNDLLVISSNFGTVYN